MQRKARFVRGAHASRRAISGGSQEYLVRRDAEQHTRDTYAPQKYRDARLNLCGANFGCRRHFDQFPGADIIYVAVDRYRGGNERMTADARHIGQHTACLILEGEPVDKVTSIRSGTLTNILPFPLIKLRRFETFLSSRRISESLNRAIPQSVW